MGFHRWISMFSHTRAQKHCNQRDMHKYRFGANHFHLLLATDNIFIVKFGACAMIWAARSLHHWQKAKKNEKNGKKAKER